jgi:hypothetical protein
MIQFIPEPYGREAFDAFLRNLLFTDWESPDSPLRLNADLKPADLADAGFFFNARLFLATLAEEDGAPATTTGNLTRVFVGQMFDRLKLPQPFRDSTRRFCKVVNEQDVWPLHLVRVISQCAKLVARRKKRFYLTKAGRALISDDQAGALYRTLFLAYFQRFDLRYDFHFRDVPGIQATMAVILWRLDTVAHDWTPVRGLAPDVLLPVVLHQMHEAMTYEYDTEEWILAGYILDPLFDLGLIETKKGGEWSKVTQKDHIRVTALWRKFITFAWNGGRLEPEPRSRFV